MPGSGWWSIVPVQPTTQGRILSNGVHDLAPTILLDKDFKVVKTETGSRLGGRRGH
jgi:hypothetical protein